MDINKLNKLYTQLDERKRNYGIVDTKPQSFQQPLLDAIYSKDDEGNNTYRFLLYQGWNWSWKCWAKGSEFIMYNWEYKKVEDIKIWDVLMWPDSKPRNVLSLWRGEEEMFTIHPERDEPFTVNKSHILSLIQRRRNSKWERKKNCNIEAPEWEIVNITVEDYLKKSNRWKSEAKLWRPNKILFKGGKKLKVDPYFLWLWLWDWSVDRPLITNVDEEINNYLYSFAEDKWLSITRWYSLVTKRWQPNSLLDDMRMLGVIWNKHIPIDYYSASFSDRLNLFAWLIDSDWYKDWWKGYAITQKRENIIDDLAFVCRSVWLKVRKTSSISVMKRVDWTTYKCKTYRLNIQGSRCIDIPCKVERKKQYNINKKTDSLVTWFRVESIGVGEYFGFQLDWDHLCLNKQFIVQHNTFIAMYAVSCLAMWDLCRNYWIKYIWAKKKIYVGTKSGSNLKGLEDYLIWDYSPTRLPPEVVSKVVRDNWGIKEIHLVNGCRIVFFTYDQWRERIQGTNGDLYVFDEEPTKSDIFYEGLARLRTKKAQAIYSFTPLSWHTAVYEYFYEQESENVVEQSFMTIVNSLQNKHWDHTWAEGLTEHERKMRIEGLFVPPSGLVYANFDREKNVVPFFDPKELWSNTKYYGTVDFWVKHPTAFAMIAVDEDENVYVYDLLYKSGLLIKDLAKGINAMKAKHQVSLEYIVADTAGKRERTELQELGIRTQPADKWTKGENSMSNRRAGIMKVNQLLADGKLFIADHLKDAIKEFETHYYKENGLDGAVEKINDDFLDSLRYFIFGYKPPKFKSRAESMFEKKHKFKYSKHAVRNRNTRKPY